MMLQSNIPLGEDNIPADVFSRLAPKPTNATLNQILVLQCTDTQRALIKENHEWMHAHSGVDRTILHCIHRMATDALHDRKIAQQQHQTTTRSVTQHYPLW